MPHGWASYPSRRCQGEETSRWLGLLGATKKPKEDGLEDHAITVRKVEKTARSGKGRVAGRGRRAQEGGTPGTLHGASECLSMFIDYPFRPCRADVCPVCGGVLLTKGFYHT